MKSSFRTWLATRDARARRSGMTYSRLRRGKAGRGRPADRAARARPVGHRSSRSFDAGEGPHLQGDGRRQRSERAQRDAHRDAVAFVAVTLPPLVRRLRRAYASCTHEAQHDRDGSDRRDDAGRGEHDARRTRRPPPRRAAGSSRAARQRRGAPSVTPARHATSRALGVDPRVVLDRPRRELGRAAAAARRRPRRHPSTTVLPSRPIM